MSTLSKHGVVFPKAQGLRKRAASDILRLIVAKLGVNYKSSSVQLNLPESLAKEIKAWGRKNIPDSSLIDDEEKSMGREDEIHITVLYGLLDEDPEVIKDLLRGKGPIKVTLGKISSFDTAKNHDVIKIDIHSPDLHQLNYIIRENVSYLSNFPIYKPHTTIAYVRKGSADSLLGSTDISGIEFEVDSLEYSGKSGKKTTIKIT